MADGGDGKATITIGETGQFTGKLIDFLFISSGNTSDKWLGIGNGSTASNTLPLIMPQECELTALTFSNQDDNVDMDIQVFINGSLHYTWEMRNKRTAWKTDISGAGTIAQGARVSLFMKKFTGGTDDQTAQDPVVAVFFVYTDDNDGEGGTQNGV